MHSIGDGMESIYANNEMLASYIRNKKGGAYNASYMTASVGELLKAQRGGGLRPRGINGLSLSNLNIPDRDSPEMNYGNSFF
jgi:hypothetical protein